MNAAGITFTGGILRVEDNNEATWDEFKQRIDFEREVRGLRIKFLTANKTDGYWEIPFVGAEVDFQDASTKELLEKDTPYQVASYKQLEPAKVDVSMLRLLRMATAEDAIGTWINEVRPQEELKVERPEDVFDGLVGMESQRMCLMKLSKALAVGGRGAIDCFHFSFTGAPGTGKTELAKRMSQYLDLVGVTDGTGRFVKVGEADVVAKYVGHTAPKVKSIVQSALGGVLFIDEFYAIANAPHFGQEAIDCLTDQLDEYRHDFVCIVAGYKDEVNETLDMNAGLRDRFGYHVDFPDYTDDELAQIFRLLAGRRQLELSCEEELGGTVSRLRRLHGFSNARTVRRLVDACVCESTWNHDSLEVTPADLEGAYRDLEEQAKQKAYHMGF